jgi:hypothetical protein
MSRINNNWKLKLRYGQLTTPYKHFSVIADGVAGELTDGFQCPPGQAYIGMKVWASSHDEAIDMVQSIGEQIGFTVTGKIEIFTTSPEQPPEENPYGYDIKFSPYKT